MRHEESFEIAVAVGLAHRLWRRYGETSESAAGQVRFEPAGEDRTRVRLAMEAEPETVQKHVREFTRFVQAHQEEESGDGPRDSMGGDLSRAPGESGMPLVGRMDSPGAPGSGIGIGAAMNKFPKESRGADRRRS